MSRGFIISRRVWLLSSLLCWYSAAQPVPPAPANPEPRAALPPFPTNQKSPVDSFRELLSMPLPEQNEYLASKPQPQRTLLSNKVREYQAMTPNDREIRLKVTQLRWYLLPLMRMPATNRPGFLQSIPEEDRKLVEQRMQLWDLYPQLLQEQILENANTLRFVSETNPTVVLPSHITPAQKENLEREIARWQALSAQERKNRSQQFSQFFELSETERAKTLRVLSPAERQQMERSLQAFEALPKEKRHQCIESFNKFAQLSPEEREEFFKNASRWQAMTPNERQSWRQLVARVPQFPPMPPQVSPSISPAIQIATNSSQ